MPEETITYMVLGPKGTVLDDRKSPYADERDNPTLFHSLRSAMRFALWFEKNEKDMTEIVRLETIVPYDMDFYDQSVG